MRRPFPHADLGMNSKPQSIYRITRRLEGYNKYQKFTKITIFLYCVATEWKGVEEQWRCDDADADFIGIGIAVGAAVRDLVLAKKATRNNKATTSLGRWSERRVNGRSGSGSGSGRRP